MAVELAEAILTAAVEFAGVLFEAISARRPLLGESYRARRTMNANAYLLDDARTPFEIKIPKGAVVRVARDPADTDHSGLAVALESDDDLQAASTSLRSAVRAFGYFVPMPPGIIRTDFTRVKHLPLDQSLHDCQQRLG